MLFYRRALRGFTLLELMVVIAIISILASLTAPTFTRQIAKAKLVEVLNLATQHQAVIEEHILLHGDFPSNSEFQLVKQQLKTDSIVKSITVSEQNKATGTMVISLNNNTGIQENQYLQYSRNLNRNWQCISDLAPNLLPAQCISILGSKQ